MQEEKYYKLLRADLTHYGFKYQLGLNINDEPFNQYEFSNGMYFYREEQIARWINDGDNLAVVSIPQDAQVCHFTDQSKADKIHIEKIIPLANWDRWNDLEFCLNAVRQNGLALKFVKEQTPKICLEACKENGNALEYVKEQTPEICLEAVKENGLVLQFVKEQNSDICLEAVRQNGLALEYVKEQTEEICLTACRNNGKALQFVKEQTEEICLEAVRQSGFALEYVRNQTEEICQEAVMQNKYALNYVRAVPPSSPCELA